MAFLPCLNPNCSSKGQSHPNCHCYDKLSGDQIAALGSKGYELPGQTKGMTLQGVRGGNAQRARAAGRSVRYMADGGEIQYCDFQIPHKPGCQYFVDGGEVQNPTPMPAPQPVNPNVTLGHVAADQGLLGILQNVGGLTLNSPKDHEKTFEKARSYIQENNHEKAVDLLHGHPLTGRANRSKTAPIVERLAPEILSKQPDAGAFRAASDYLHSSMKGHDSLSSQISDFFGKQKKTDEMKPSIEHRKELNDFLKWTQESPQALLDVGGSLGHYLPDHAAAVGALSAQAVDYLNAIRPKETQISPLDKPVPPSPMAQQEFDRQLDIAQNPKLILQHVRNGTLLPSDVKTVQLLYPALYQSMVQKASEALIEAKTEDKEIPYHQSVSLGLFFGEPLDCSMTTSSMQAIMQANSSQESSQAPPPKKQSKKGPTAAQLKQIDKVDEMYETPIETRQLNKKS